jgi:hypothetical protein
MIKLIISLCFLFGVVSGLNINCYYITSFIQENDVFLYPETEARLHRECPSVSVHLVNGNKIYEGVVETLLNRIDGSPDCDGDSFRDKEEDRILKSIGLSCKN